MKGQRPFMFPRKSTDLAEAAVAGGVAFSVISIEPRPPNWQNALRRVPAPSCEVWARTNFPVAMTSSSSEPAPKGLYIFIPLAV